MTSNFSAGTASQSQQDSQDRPPKRRIPHRIETERLVLRCYDPSDAEELRSRVEANVQHLGEFMPWIQFEPQTLEQKVELILGFRAAYDAGDNQVMGIFEGAGGKLIGGTGLHPSGSNREASGGDGTGPLEIGYWVDHEQEGKGFISESVRALCVVAFRFLPLERLVIRMEPSNTRSEVIPKKLGFHCEGTARRTIAYPNDAHPGERRDAMVYSLLRDEFEAADWRASTEANTACIDSSGNAIDLNHTES